MSSFSAVRNALTLPALAFSTSFTRAACCDASGLVAGDVAVSPGAGVGDDECFICTRITAAAAAMTATAAMAEPASNAPERRFGGCGAAPVQPG
jgi:hypothetical protein